MSQDKISFSSSRLIILLDGKILSFLFNIPKFLIFSINLFISSSLLEVKSISKSLFNEHFLIFSFISFIYSIIFSIVIQLLILFFSLLLFQSSSLILDAFDDSCILFGSFSLSLIL